MLPSSPTAQMKMRRSGVTGVMLRRVTSLMAAQTDCVFSLYRTVDEAWAAVAAAAKPTPCHSQPTSRTAWLYVSAFDCATCFVR